ncbi:putative proline-rich protein 36 [Iris pallida]|uniref:Proline-rich protein 36 n=1 Tax=Iris pallida TaxID=29817 RepID=A0AAX6EQN3_IRIPA|nr:putative proline-rich protein 36 [Iris pallida]
MLGRLGTVELTQARERGDGALERDWWCSVRRRRSLELASDTTAVDAALPRQRRVWPKMEEIARRGELARRCGHAARKTRTSTVSVADGAVTRLRRPWTRAVGTRHYSDGFEGAARAGATKLGAVEAAGVEVGGDDDGDGSSRPAEPG